MDQPDSAAFDGAAQTEQAIPDWEGPSPPGTSVAPRVVAGYEILEEIGRGSMGVVYKARQPDLNRPIALKELHRVYADTPGIVRRFARESRLAGSLNHPNIVTVYQYIEQHGVIVMEYLPRGSLRPWVGRISLAQLAGVLEGLLLGLAAVEPSGIVHRDLKPENIMVTDDGRVKIGDFGIAKATQSGDSSFMTAAGASIGTPAYMAPEQALGETVGPWTDLYAVGVMAYEQLVGRVPFHDNGVPVSVMLRHVHDPIPSVLDSRPDLDSSLAAWVAQLLVKQPSQRTQSAMQAWEELEEIILGLLGPLWRRDARLPRLTASPSADSDGPGFATGPRPGSAAGEGSAAAQPVRGRRVGLSRSRRTVGVALLAALISGGAGFLLAPDGESAKAPAREGNSTGSQVHEPSRAYAVALGEILSTLNHTRATTSAQLTHAKSAHGQAQAAQQLARAQRQATAAVRRIVPPPPARSANAAIATALAEMGGGYTAISRAASDSNRRGYNSGRATVGKGAASLAVAFTQLRRLGYRFGR